jgi:hypothetical protein
VATTGKPVETPEEVTEETEVETPPKSAGEQAIDEIANIASEMAQGTYFSNPPEVLKANRSMIGKFIEIAEVIRKSHDELLDAQVAVGNPNVADYKRFRKKNESTKDPLKDLFK